jgi:hypothetical protein
MFFNSDGSFEIIELKEDRLTIKKIKEGSDKFWIPRLVINIEEDKPYETVQGRVTLLDQVKIGDIILIHFEPLTEDNKKLQLLYWIELKSCDQFRSIAEEELKNWET